MSSSPKDSTIISSSPQSIRVIPRDESPLRHRDSSPTAQRSNTTNDIDRAHSNSPTIPRHSPSISRAHHNPLDPETRERQRTLDAGMAMHLSRARRSSVTTSPTIPTSFHHYEHGIPHEHVNQELLQHDDIFPTFPLSEEEQEFEGTRPAALDLTGADSPREGVDDYERTLNQDLDEPSPFVLDMHESISIHPSGLTVEPDSHEAGLPLYQPPAAQDSHSFRFELMDEFARGEKHKLGLASSESERPPTLRHRSNRTDDSEPGPSNATRNFTLPPTRPARERRLSHGVTPPRRHAGGKMALFEAATLGTPTHTGALMPPPSGAATSALSSFENLPTAPISQGTGGHDRPYRFSFYSNALGVTIHSRSLSELPSEGQSFEDLFTGSSPATNHAAGKKGGTNTWSEPSTAPQSLGTFSRPTSALLVPGKSDSRTVNGGDPGTPLRGAVSEDTEGYTWWLDILSPTDEEMKMLSKVFGIHPLTTEDIQMEEAREKIELFRTYYLVCFRSFDQDAYSPTHLEPVNMYIIVFREGILSFHFRPTPHPQNVRRRIKQLRDYISVTSDWISYALIDDITDAFGPLIQSIEYEVDSIDELVLILKETEQSDMLRRIGTCRKKVMGLLRLMGSKADVVKGLAKRCNENWKVAPTGDIGLYLSDIQDHLITMTQNLNHYEKILSRSHSNYLAQISIEMTDANNQINDVLSKLTALGTVLIPMNLITGLWGMNVHVPGQDVAEGYVWFGSIIGGLAAIALIGGYTTYKLMVR